MFREEATAIIHGAHRRKESGTLAAYEEQMNDVRYLCVLICRGCALRVCVTLICVLCV